MAEFLILDKTEASSSNDNSEEGLGELLLECHNFLNELLARRQSKWVERDGQRLLKRLGSFVEWQTLH
jgi:hypothetical protein